MQKIYSKDDLLFDIEIYDDDTCFDQVNWELIKEFTVKIWTTDESKALTYTLPDLISYRLPISAVLNPDCTLKASEELKTRSMLSLLP